MKETDGGQFENNWLIQEADEPIASRRIAIQNLERMLAEGKALELAMYMYATDEMFHELGTSRDELLRNMHSETPTAEAYLHEVRQRARNSWNLEPRGAAQHA